MGRNWQIGSLLGIPLYLDSSWFIVLALVTLANVGDIQRLALAGDRLWLVWVAGLLLALLLFASVVLHELGHSTAALAQGIKVNSIALFLFGGVAAIERESSTPKGAFWVAIAGPGVSFGLYGLLQWLADAVAGYPLLTYMFSDLARINLWLGLFNLIPGLPLDGGQVLKALVWQVSGDRRKGIRWAAASGKLWGGLTIAASLLLILATGQPVSLWLGLIGWFIFNNASLYDRQARLEDTILKMTAGEAMSSEFRVVDARLTLLEFTERYLLGDGGLNIDYFAASEGRYRGQIRVGDLHDVARGEWDSLTLADIAHPLADIPAVGEATPLYEAIAALDAQSAPRLTVLSPAGAVAGTVDRGDIVRAIASNLHWPVPPQELQRIKAEGRYPNYLQLSTLAKSLQNETS